MAALQGLVNRDQPRLYVYLVGDHGRVDRDWLARLQARANGWSTRGCVLSPICSHWSAPIAQSVRGAVVWDERVPATALIASTAAGVEDLLPLRFDSRPDSLYSRLVVAETGPRLPVVLRLLNDDGTPMFTGSRTGSAKCDALLWAADRFLKTGKSDPTWLGYYPDAWWLTGTPRIAPVNTLLSNHDDFIARRGFFFDLGPWDDESPDDDRAQPPGTDAKTLRAILAAAHEAARGRMIHVGGFTPWDQKYTDYTGGRHGGVPTEWRYAEILSCFDAYMDADAPGLHAMANASVFHHFPLAERYPQKGPPSAADLLARGFLDGAGHVAARNFAAIYAGDYDSAAWLYHQLPEVWDDPARAGYRWAGRSIPRWPCASPWAWPTPARPPRPTTCSSRATPVLATSIPDISCPRASGAGCRRDSRHGKHSARKAIGGGICA